MLILKGDLWESLLTKIALLRRLFHQKSLFGKSYNFLSLEPIV